MRKFLSGLFVTTLLAFTHGQNITYRANEAPLSEVLAAIEEQFEVYFSFAVDDISALNVSLEVEDQPIDAFLQTLLAPYQLQFELVSERFYAITKAVNVHLRLVLVDHETGEKLPFGTARIVGTTQGFVGDLKGDFDLLVEQPHITVLEFSFVGYRPFQVAAHTIDPTRLVQIELEKEVRQLDGVTIREYLNKGITTDDRASSIAIDVQKMEILPGLSERDVLLSAQILAGIGSADESASGLNIRGSASNNSLLYWNNIPVYQAAHYFGNISAFIPSAVGKLEVFKNHIPLDYGGSSSGLLLMETRKGGKDWTGETSMNLTHADFYTHVPMFDGDVSLTLAGRRSYNDLLSTPTFVSLSDKLFEGTFTQDLQQGLSNDEFGYNSKLVFSDLNMVVDYELSSREELSFHALYSQSQLDYNSSSDEELASAQQTHNVDSKGANLTWARRWHHQLSTTLSSSFTDYHMDYGLLEESEDEDEAVSNNETRANDLMNWENRFSLHYNPIENHYLKAGYQYNLLDASLTIDERSFLEEDFIEQNKSQETAQGVFLDYFGKFKYGIQLGAGIRQNWYSSVEEARTDRHLRFNYELNKNWLIKSSWGHYNQFITSLQEVDFIFSNTIEQNWIIASEESDVPVIRNDQWVLGVLMENGGWLIDLDLFTKDVDAPISRSFGPQVDGEAEALVVGTERITGLDLMLKRKWRHYKAWLSYSFQDSEVAVEVEDEPDIEFPSGINVRHQFQLSQAFHWNDWEFSVGYTRKTGLPFTQPEALLFFEEEDETFYEIRFQEINAQRLNAYERVDLSIWYKFQDSNKLPFNGEIGLSVLNVLDRDNLFSRSFDIDGEEDEVFITRLDRRLIGITPNLSVRLTW